MRWERPSLTPDKVRPHIEKHFDYYRRLPAGFKIEFENKLIEFIDRKDFTPRQMQSVTEEMKVLISAAATQLTFGLPDIYLENFSRILVYPDDYYSTIFKRYHRGEVNLGGGIIVLSWRSYGGVSIDEFFAVAIENFFERPVGFHQEHPRLYKFTVLLLRQDPIRLLSLAQ